MALPRRGARVLQLASKQGAVARRMGPQIRGHQAEVGAGGRFDETQRERTWNGGLKDGHGKFSVSSGVLKDVKYSFRTRFETSRAPTRKS